MKIKTIKDKKSFTIDRTKWVRGDIGGTSLLLNDRGNMCCLGHYSKACGIAENDLRGNCGPSDALLSNILNENQLGKAWLANYRQSNIEIIDWKSKLFNIFRRNVHNDDYPFNFDADNTAICETLMHLNDDRNITEAEREEYIKKEFAKIGVKVKFIN